MSARALLLAGAIGPVLFYVVFLIDGATRPAYDAWRNFISTLALTDRGWVQTANFIVCGTLITIGALGLWRVGASRAAAIGVAVIGLGIVGAGLFAAGPETTYPPARVPFSPGDTEDAHRFVSLIVFTLLGIVPIVSGLRARLRDGWSRYSVVSGIVSLVLFIGFAWLATRSDGSLPIGFVQRLTVLVGFGWLVAVFMRYRAAEKVAVLRTSLS